MDYWALTHFRTLTCSQCDLLHHLRRHVLLFSPSYKQDRAFTGLGIPTSTTGVRRSIPGQGTKIPHAAQQHKNNKNKIKHIFKKWDTKVLQVDLPHTWQRNIFTQVCTTLKAKVADISSQLVIIFLPQKHMAMFGDVFDYHMRREGCYRKPVSRGQGCC